MTSRNKQAREPAQKVARRRVIMEAAAALYAEAAFEQITIASVAKRAGLAKGTVYLYFHTKEEIFLALLIDALEQWEHEMASSLGAASGPARVAQALSQQLVDRQAMVRLLGLMHNILEQNISVEAALEFKQRLLGLLLRAGALIEAAVPGLPSGRGARFMMRLHVLVVGLGQVCRPSASVQEAMRLDPALGVMQVELDQELCAMIEAQLRGLMG